MELSGTTCPAGQRDMIVMEENTGNMTGHITGDMEMGSALVINRGKRELSFRNIVTLPVIKRKEGLFHILEILSSEIRGISDDFM